MALTKQARMQVIISRILAKFPDNQQRYVSGYGDSDQPTIDDGPAYDGRKPPKPDFLIADDKGWETSDVL